LQVEKSKMNELPKIISLHLPKTGGSTFRQMLKKMYGPQFFLARIKRMPGDIEKYRCIHGHMRMYFFDNVTGWNFITWVRDPIERAISEFYWKDRNRDRMPSTWNLKLLDKGLDVFIDRKSDKYLKSIGDNFHRFDFVGITELWDLSIERLKRQLFGRDLPKQKKYVLVSIPIKNENVPRN